VLVHAIIALGLHYTENLNAQKKDPEKIFVGEDLKNTS
jgi:hypothetical protein